MNSRHCLLDLGEMLEGTRISDEIYWTSRRVIICPGNHGLLV